MHLIWQDVQYSTIQYGTVQYNTVQYSTIQYSTVQYSAVEYSTVQCSRVQYSTVQYSTVQYSTVQCSTVQYNTVQYSTVQYSTVRVLLHVLYVGGLPTLNVTFWTKRPTDGISVSSSYLVIITEMPQIFFSPGGQSYHYTFGYWGSIIFSFCYFYCLFHYFQVKLNY